MWYGGNQAAAAEVERASAGNMKRTWAAWHTRDWLDPRQGEGRGFLREATPGKNIWIPYGEQCEAAEPPPSPPPPSPPTPPHATPHTPRPSATPRPSPPLPSLPNP